MSSARSLFESFVIMILCLLVAYVIAAFVLMPYEIVRDQFDLAGMNAVSDPVFITTTEQNSMLNLAYFVTYFLTFFGPAQFVWTAVRRQKYDVMEEQ